ncbi:MAG TPA: hypothetical protein VE999_12795 [Gemmataceae bacterium]|nr:hypothetical protein [Gemmataceae bacterium]
MYSYRCPGCGKHHSVDGNFEQAFESTCLRCGVAISVTPELIQQSQSGARPSRALPAREETITKSPANKAVGVAGNSKPVVGAEEDGAALDPELTMIDPDMTLEYQDDLDDEGSKSTTKKSKPKQNEKPRQKKKLPRREDPDEDIDDEEVEVPEQKPSLPPAKAAEKGKSSRPRWKAIVPIAVGAVILCGVGGFLMFGGGKKPEPKQAAKAPSKPAAKPAAKPAKQEAPKKEAPPAPKAPPTTRDVAISATRLSAELAVNAALTNAKYAGKVLDVTGLFKQIQSKDGLHPPARPHAVFNVGGSEVSCNLQGTFTDINSWRRLNADAPITVRGTYEKDGYLRECLLLPFTPTADNNYKDKIVEVIGHVAEVLPADNLRLFPIVRLEGDTDSTVELRFFFRQTDAEEVNKIHVGSLLTIQGKCGGWKKEINAGEYVRFDNCQLVYTSAPTNAEIGFNPGVMIRKLMDSSAQTGSVPRLEAARILREYGEDLHPYYLPPPGQEETIDTPLTIRQLAKEHTADPKAFEKKYRRRILHVTGKLAPKKGDRIVYLSSGDTDLAFQVECRFSRAEYEFLRQRHEPDYRIRGLFTVMTDPNTLRLDNCQLDLPRSLGPVVTQDFLPHKPGNSFTIDVAAYGVPVNNRPSNVVHREVHVQGKDGYTEITTTHLGKFAAKSLFEQGAQEDWVHDKKGRIVHAPTTSGIYFRRVHAGFIEIGTPHLSQDGSNKTEIDWAPVLKLDVKAGDRWTWTTLAGAHDFVVEKFDDYQGHPCAVLLETITLGSDVLHPVEILHVYAKGLGEVERREWRRLDQRGGKKLLSEMKWVPSSPPNRGSETKALGGKPSVPAPAPAENKTNSPAKK